MRSDGATPWASAAVLGMVLALALALTAVATGVRAAPPAFSQLSLTTRAVTVFTHAHAAAGEQYTQHHYTLALVTAHANQPLYVRVPSAAPKPAAAPAGAPAAATPTPSASPSASAWEDLWPITDLRAEQEHAYDHGKGKESSEQQQLLLRLAELRCGTGASAVRYPFAPFGAAPSDGAPFFPPEALAAASAADVLHTRYGALPVPVPQSQWLPLLTRLPEPGLERALDVDLSSNNLYAVLFVTAYERHNSTARNTPAADDAEVHRVQFGPPRDRLAECALVLNPTRRRTGAAAAPGTGAGAGAGATAAVPATNLSLSNFAQQHVPPNTRLELRSAAVNHVLRPTHVFALHDDVPPPHALTTHHAAGTTAATAAEADAEADGALFGDDGEPLPPTLNPAAAFLPPQFLESRPAHAHGRQNASHAQLHAQHMTAPGECAAAIEEGRAAFIETGTGQLAGILNPVLTAMAEPFIDQFNDLVTSWVMLDLEENFVHGMLGGIPPLVSEPLTFILKRNITNLVTDAVTHGVTQRLAPTISNYIAPFLTATIANDVVPRVARGVHRAISDTVPHRLQYSIPKALARAIPVITTYRTVMGVTHSLVPTLTRILSHTSNSERFCYYCQHYQQHCGDCHYININSFNIQFYSGFYSDYFGAYYADYYAQATKDLQFKLHDIKGEPYTEEDTEMTKLNPPPDDD